ncbi:site-specific integrase [Haloactinopolyspora sp.]|uniref:tyrosine-type recombinase/integrase n=1 Tax=Haloactinopolyspora sp. TaxID=1966353 RepID=UPI00262C00B3|nr:site-specific integrase [Haloactinopolyspora sp.]
MLGHSQWVDPAAGRVRFGVVADEWLGTILHLKPSTRQGYQIVLRRRVLPTWERVPLSKITHDGLVEWVNDLVRGGISSSQIHQAAYVLSSVCRHAVQTSRLARNPMTGVKLPRLQAQKDHMFLTHEQVGRLAAAAGRYSTLIRTLAYTGLRWGEVSALRVRDVDLSRRRMDVRRAFADIGGRVVEGTPKSHQARTVPLPRWLAAELAPLVDSKELDDLVFTSPDGGPLRKSNFRRRAWAPAVRAAGLDGLTPHGLRHTAASLYISAGTPPKVVQRILGHASITVTLDLYGHLYPDEMDTWADRLGDIAGNSGGAVWPEGGQNAGSDAGESDDAEGQTP